MSRSFLELLALHKELDELFLCHQEALLSLDVDRAVEILWDYEEKLLAHMREAEDLLLPLYGARAGRVPGGPVELFTGEHRKMRAFLQEFHRWLVQIQAEDPARVRRSIILLIDREAMYKSLVTHHDLRERNILYPWMDRLTTEEERILLLERCGKGKAGHKTTGADF